MPVPSSEKRASGLAIADKPTETLETSNPPLELEFEDEYPQRNRRTTKDGPEELDGNDGNLPHKRRAEPDESREMDGDRPRQRHRSNGNDPKHPGEDDRQSQKRSGIGSSVPVWGWLVLLLAVIVLLSSVCGGIVLIINRSNNRHNDKNSDVTQINNQSNDINFDNVVWDYQNNHVAADAKYLGKRGRATLVVHSIGRTKQGVAYLAWNGLGDPQVRTMYWFFPKETESQLTLVREGKTYTLAGICRGVNGNTIEFHDCRVLGDQSTDSDSDLKKRIREISANHPILVAWLKLIEAIETGNQTGILAAVNEITSAYLLASATASHPSLDEKDMKVAVILLERAEIKSSAIGNPSPLKEPAIVGSSMIWVTALLKSYQRGELVSSPKTAAAPTPPDQHPGVAAAYRLMGAIDKRDRAALITAVNDITTAALMASDAQKWARSQDLEWADTMLWRTLSKLNDSNEHDRIRGKQRKDEIDLVVPACEWASFLLLKSHIMRVPAPPSRR